MGDLDEGTRARAEITPRRGARHVSPPGLPYPHGTARQCCPRPRVLLGPFPWQRIPAPFCSVAMGTAMSKIPPARSDARGAPRCRRGIPGSPTEGPRGLACPSTRQQEICPRSPFHCIIHQPAARLSPCSPQIIPPFSAVSWRAAARPPARGRHRAANPGAERRPGTRTPAGCGDTRWPGGPVTPGPAAATTTRGFVTGGVPVPVPAMGLVLPCTGGHCKQMGSCRLLVPLSHPATTPYTLLCPHAGPKGAGGPRTSPTGPSARALLQNEAVRDGSGGAGLSLRSSAV